MSSHAAPPAATGDASGERPLRRDAERNRLLVVRAAQAVFARRGLAAGLNDVAHEAGVGVGTVYRRFTSKEELVEAALQEPFDDMVRTAAAALAADDPWDGLVLFLDRAADLLAANLGLREVALGAAPESELFAGLRARFEPVAEELIARAHAGGQLDEGVGPADVLVLLCVLTEVARHSPEGSRLYRRYLQMFLEGARRADGRPALPEPLDRDAAAALAARWTANG